MTSNMTDPTPRKPDTKDGVYFDDPELPEGWTRKCVQRSTGQSAGKWDVYIYNPMGRKFRSQNEVRRYLGEINSELCPDLFCFNPYAQAGTPSSRKPGSKSGASSVKKLTNKAVKAMRAKSLGGAGDASSTKLKLKFDFSKRMGRPPSAGKPGRPAGKPGRPPSASKSGQPSSSGHMGRPGSSGKPGRPASAGKPGRPFSSGKPGRPPGRPAGSGSSLASPPLRTPASKFSPSTTPRVAMPAVSKGPGAPKKRPWTPPESPYDLVQERYYQDPWKLLIASIFLSKPPETSPEDVWGDPPPVLEARRARPLLEQFFERWPTAKAARDASAQEIASLIEPLQLGEHAADLIIRFSDEFLTKKWKSPTELYGIGRYGSDAYRIFCLGQWKQVRPLDHMLSLYHNWLWTNYKALRLE
ncbi:methyl-CpG-binding domain protein 4-like isoform X1 [Amphibalanus amphitrite]|nr:methyl-CpG-binding domain protein 4-like isoform X1 [Amphibalanus amphitrite]